MRCGQPGLCSGTLSQNQVEMCFECLHSRNTFFKEEIFIGWMNFPPRKPLVIVSELFLLEIC